MRLSNIIHSSKDIDVIFLITSVISLSLKPLNNNISRSMFSTNDRVKQTLDSIKTIRSKVPNARIIMLEGGKVDFSQQFSTLVDEYHYMNSKIARFFVDHKNKGLGEVYLLGRGLRALPQKKEMIAFKIAGRYELNESFEISRYLDGDVSFRVSHTLVHSKHFNKPIRVGELNTIIYSFYGNQKRYMLFTIYKALIPLLMNFSVENVFYYLVSKRKLNSVSMLGITGQISSTGEEISL